MLIKILIQSIVTTIILTFIAACATSKSTINTGGEKIATPKVAKFYLPGGDTETWRYIGTTDDNQIADEINDSSINSSSVQIYKYQDRKTIIDPKTFKYPISQTPYKFVLGLWQIDCANQQYILNQATTFDTYGTPIKTYDYTNDNSVKWIKFGTGSIAYMQYNYICLNQNKNLGY